MSRQYPCPTGYAVGDPPGTRGDVLLFGWFFRDEDVTNELGERDVDEFAAVDVTDLPPIEGELAVATTVARIDLSIVPLTDDGFDRIHWPASGVVLTADGANCSAWSTTCAMNSSNDFSYVSSMRVPSLSKTSLTFETGRSGPG